MKSEKTARYTFEFSGGALCLDFCNTVPDRPGRNKEHLTGYGDLLEWALQAKLLREKEWEDLRKAAVQCPEERDRVFSSAIELREDLFGVFAGVASNGRQWKGALNNLNGFLSGAMRRAQVKSEVEVFSWTWVGWGKELDCMLWPVVRSAADLMTSADAGRIRECASDTCSWLFLDRSRTCCRRWCDMKTCGNRAKARRHYLRKKKQVRTA